MPEGEPKEVPVEAGEEAVREQDKYLPIANISRIMKRALPTNAKIAKDAKEVVQEYVSEFISFVTSEASDKCLREKRKTINGDDLLWAMTTLGFEDSIDVLRIYLGKYREAEGERTTKPAVEVAAPQVTTLPGMVPQQAGAMPSLPAGYTMAYAPMCATPEQQQQQQQAQLQQQQEMMGMVPNAAP